LFLQAKPVNHTHQLGESPLERIAVVRALGGLGDLLCTVPAFRSLRAAFPQAEIVLVGLPVVKPLVKRFDRYLDRLLEFPGYPGLPEQPLQVQQIPAFLQLVQNDRFDLAIQMHGSGTVTNSLTMLLGSRINAGFFLPGQYCPDENCFLPYLPYESEVRRYLRLLEFLGIPSQGEELEFPLYEEDKQELHAIAQSSDLVKGEYVCIHPGATTPARCWSKEGFAAVGDALAQLGLRVVLTGSKHEVELCEAVASMMKAPSINLAGCTSLGALAALLNDARLLVCNDTGVSHLAAALGVKSVVIFTHSDPERWAPLDRDRHRIVCHTAEITPESALAFALAERDAVQPGEQSEAKQGDLVQLNEVIAQAKDLLQKEDAYVA
jgi:ADP-heptose:LPS heptosyltransferase